MPTQKILKDYPQTYFRIVETVARTGKALSTTLDLLSARSSRRDLYRFFAAIREADTDGDSYAKDLFITSQNLMVRIDPNSGHKDDEVILSILLNPLTDLFEDLDCEEVSKPPQLPERADKVKPSETKPSEPPKEDTIDLSNIEDLIIEAQKDKDHDTK